MLRFGLIGAGRIGTVHARNVTAHREAVLACITDPDQARAADLADQTGASVSPDLVTLLSDSSIDAVIVASPTALHTAHAMAAVRADKAVLCEKPLSLQMAEARRCEAYVADSTVPFMIAFNKRFDPDIADLVARVHRGEIGRPELISFVGKDPEPPPNEYIAKSGGIFYDMMIHDIDLFLFISGERPLEVFATGSVNISEAFAQADDYDTAAVIMKVPSGLIVTQTLSRRAAFGFDQRIEVHGAHGMLRTQNHHLRRVERLTESGSTLPPLQHSFIQRYAASYAAELGHFINAVEAGKDIDLNVRHAVVVQAIADAATQSARSGRPARMDAIVYGSG
jgi:myo-inositol 2-dehydrogenase/D-chiro-inositol 1-dehydrogenase